MATSSIDAGVRTFVAIDSDRFDAVLAWIAPRLELDVENALAGDGSQLRVVLQFRGIEDFTPARVAVQVEPLRRIVEIRRRHRDLQSKIDTDELLAELLGAIIRDPDQLARTESELSAQPEAPRQPEPTAPRVKAPDIGPFSLLDMIIAASPAEEPARAEALSVLVRQLLEEVKGGQMPVSGDLETMLERRIAELDRLISGQLNLILHHPEFQKLESSWRGLHFLVSRTDTSSLIQIRVLHVTKEELLHDLEPATPLAQTGLFRELHSHLYEIPDAVPFDVLIGDFEFDNHPQDMALLKRMATVASAVHAPFLSAASPGLFGWDSFRDLARTRDLAKIFQGPEYAAWRSFRESEDSRYVALCLPHILVRLPYGRRTMPVDEFDFEEDVDLGSPENYLWGNAAFAMASCLTRAFAHHGWCARIRGVEGGMVDDLPLHAIPLTGGETARVGPTDVAIDEREEWHLAQLGFMSLLDLRNTGAACFFSAGSCHRPRVDDRPEATAYAQLSAQLPYVLAVSRIAHYVIVIPRDCFRPDMSRKDRESWLNRWIVGDVCPDPSPSAEVGCRATADRRPDRPRGRSGPPGLRRARSSRSCPTISSAG